MPKRKVLVDNDVKKSIKESNKLTGAKISYSDVYNRVADALMLMGEQREAALEQCCCDLITSVGERLVPKRILMHSNPVFIEKYKGTPAMDYTVDAATNEIKAWIFGICAMIDPNYAAKDPFIAKSTASMRDAQLNVLKGQSYADNLPAFVKKWDRHCFPRDLEGIYDVFSIEKKDKPAHVYKGDYRDKLDVIASEYYKKSVLFQEELDSHGFLWKLVFRKYVRACEEYISKVNRVLECVQFSSYYHDKLAGKVLQMNYMRPINEEVERIESNYKKITEFNEMKLDAKEEKKEHVLISEKNNEQLNADNSEKNANEKVRPVPSSQQALDEYHARYEQENVVQYHANIDETEAQRLLEDKQREIQAIMEAETGEIENVQPPVEENNDGGFLGKVANFFKGK